MRQHFSHSLLMFIALGALCSPLAQAGANDASGLKLAGIIKSGDQFKALVALPGGAEILLSPGDVVAGHTVRRVEDGEMVLVFGGKEISLTLDNARRVKPDLRVKVYASNYKGPNDFHPRSLVPATSTASARRVIAVRPAKRRVVGSNTPRFIRPMRGWVSSPFGLRRPPKTRGGGRGSRDHKGVDIAAPHGTSVVASADGQVIASAYDFAKGRYVVIRHAGGYSTAYYHLYKNLVKRGQTVKAGQRIGLEGNTGNSKGPHLHFEIRKNGRPLDPSLFVKSLKKR